MIQYKTLPVYQQKQKIIDALQTHQVIVVESNTGSGKTTQLPVILYEEGYTKNNKIIGMTQPRRIATFSVSNVIQSQLSSLYPELPQDFIGYKIRFDDNTSKDTQIKIMTDGILLQEIKLSPMLDNYSVIIIDEAHERSLNIDFILGLIREHCLQRPDLKVIISSATINTASFSEFFFQCPVININAPLHTIETHFKPPPTRSKNTRTSSRYRNGYRGRNRPPRPSSNTVPGRISSFEADEIVLLDHIIETVSHSIHKKEGDMIIFLTGEKLIKDCVERISQLPQSDALYILPLYGRLDSTMQERVFDPTPAGKTKIIVATNIAETSITIDGISVIIDPGRVKLNSFQHSKFASMLSEMPISQASALQRRGRAGRTAPGICYHLYRQDEFDDMSSYTQEEILRTDLSEVVLRMAHLGIQDFEKFRCISSPTKQAITTAVHMLQEMEALDTHNDITDIGLLMADFPLLPNHARILVEAMHNYHDCLHPILIVVSFLTTPPPFLLPLSEEMLARAAHHKFSKDDNDYLSFINLFEQYAACDQYEKKVFCERSYLDYAAMQEIVNVYNQLSDIVYEKGAEIGTQTNKKSIISAVARGLTYNICIHHRSNMYINRSGEKVYIHPSSMMFDSKKFHPIIVAAEIVKTSKYFARSVSECDLEWIQYISPYLYREINAILDAQRKSSTKPHAKKSGHAKRSSRPSALFNLRHNLEFAGTCTNTHTTTDTSKRTNQSQQRTTQSPRNAAKNSTVNASNRITAEQRTRDTTHTITIGTTTYPLVHENHKKHLKLTWREALAIVKKAPTHDIVKYGRIRCEIYEHSTILFKRIKLANVPALATIYGEHVSIERKIPQAVPISNYVKTKGKKTQVSARLPIEKIKHLICVAINVYVLPSTSQKKRSLFSFFKKKSSTETPRTHEVQDTTIPTFLSLEYNTKAGLVYIAPQDSVMIALHNTMRSLDLLGGWNFLPKKLLKPIEHKYKLLRQAYEASEPF